MTMHELLPVPPCWQAVLFTHDKVSSRDLYVPDRHFPKAAQDPVDIILSASIYNFQAMGNPIDTSAPLSREVPSCRKEDATIVFLERTNRPLVRWVAAVGGGGGGVCVCVCVCVCVVCCVQGRF